MKFLILLFLTLNKNEKPRYYSMHVENRVDAAIKCYEMRRMDPNEVNETCHLYEVNLEKTALKEIEIPKVEFIP